LIHPRHPRRRKRGGCRRATLTLADIPAGTRVQVRGFRPMDPVRRQRLQAYGLCLGQHLHVVQQSPVTIIRAAHTELAMEKDLARSIVVRAKT
jgi:Fe2+ transport system protein FeoA